MAYKLILILILLRFTVSIAYPGQCTAKAMQMWLAKTAFKYNYSIGGAAKQILLDNFYVEYFSHKTSDSQRQQQLAHHRIAIFTHIYLLQCKIEQNRRELEEILAPPPNEQRRQHQKLAEEKKKSKKEMGAEGKEKGSGAKKVVVPTMYSQFNEELSDIVKNALNNRHDDENVAALLLCRLLQLKCELLKKLRLKIFGHCMPKPNCANAPAVQQTISENREQIAEWLLSDLLHFFPERHQLIKQFEEISTRKNADEIQRAWTKFSDLIGVQRVALLWALFNDKLGAIAPFDQKAFFTLLYDEYFTTAAASSDNSVLAKWRSKLILDASIYNEWATNFFDTEHTKIASATTAGDALSWISVDSPSKTEMRSEYPTDTATALKMKKTFLDNLMADWQSYQGTFWHLEKVIQENVAFYTKRQNSAQFGQLKQLIAHVHAMGSGGCAMVNSTMMLWEDAPDNGNKILLFKPLAICMQKAVIDYDAKFLGTTEDKLTELGEKVSQHLLNCVGRRMAKSGAQSKDYFLAKLHFDKIAKLIEEDAVGAQLAKMLTEKHQLLHELMDPADIDRLANAYQHNNTYFLPSEQLVSSDEENFYDTLMCKNDAAVGGGQMTTSNEDGRQISNKKWWEESGGSDTKQMGLMEDENIIIDGIRNEKGENKNEIYNLNNEKSGETKIVDDEFVRNSDQQTRSNESEEEGEDEHLHSSTTTDHKHTTDELSELDSEISNNNNNIHYYDNNNNNNYYWPNKMWRTESGENSEEQNSDEQMLLMGEEGQNRRRSKMLGVDDVFWMGLSSAAEEMSEEIDGTTTSSPKQLVDESEENSRSSLMGDECGGDGSSSADFSTSPVPNSMTEWHHEPTTHWDEENANISDETNLWARHSQYKKDKSKRLKRVYKPDRWGGRHDNGQQQQSEQSKKAAAAAASSQKKLGGTQNSGDEQQSKKVVDTGTTSISRSTKCQQQETKCQKVPLPVEKERNLMGSSSPATAPGSQNDNEPKCQESVDKSVRKEEATSKHLNDHLLQQQQQTTRKNLASKGRRPPKSGTNSAAEVYQNKTNKKEVKYPNKCTEFLGRMGVNKFIDLIDAMSMSKWYKMLFENGLTDECGNYLNISLFAWAIDANWTFYKFFHDNCCTAASTASTQQQMMENFGKSWANFVVTELDSFDGTQFLADKLFFVLTELTQFVFEPLKIQCLKRALDYMDEPQLKQIGKNSPNVGTEKAKSTADRIKSSQFGPYNLDTFKLLLLFLRTQIFLIINAKNRMKNLGQKVAQQQQNLVAFDTQATENNWLNLHANTLMALRKMLIMQHLDEKYFQKYSQLPVIMYEKLQYGLIRCSTEIKKMENNISDDMASLIATREHNTEDKQVIMILRDRIKRILFRWASKQSKEIYLRLVTNGSYALKAELDGSDLDLLCFASNDVNVYKFYGEEPDSVIFALKKELSDVSNIVLISGRVKMIKIEHRLINVDLGLVPVPKKYMEKVFGAFDTDQIFAEIKFDSAIYSLAGFRSTKFLIRNISDYLLFKSLLKIVKIWAKNRLIDSSIFGYLNGTALSVMAAKIAILFPNASLIYLCQQFFAIYSQWDWPNVPVLVDELSTVSLNERAHQFWPPKFAAQPMTVITPMFPEQNATFNVNKFTREVIVEELKNANQVLSVNVQNWRAAFEEIPVKAHFRHFALIVCQTPDSDGFVKNCGFQKSKIRQHLLAWAERGEVSKRLKRFQVIPRYEQRFLCANHNRSIGGGGGRGGKSSPNLGVPAAAFCMLWLVGLSAHDEFYENFIDNLLPIYRHDHLTSAAEGNNDAASLFIGSIFTKSTNLDETIHSLTLQNDNRKLN